MCWVSLAPRFRTRQREGQARDEDTRRLRRRLKVVVAITVEQDVLPVAQRQEKDPRLNKDRGKVLPPVDLGHQPRFFARDRLDVRRRDNVERPAQVDPFRLDHRPPFL
ncbi:MAG: hypothetical protein KatS3mg061_2629 [Dehalococcoidia bacterium]|nr:MAG: hypothetical protein KatS3mg061_2629 [Dehalococcoidia bacterium]